MPRTSTLNPSVDASVAAPSSDGVSFRHFEMGDSEIDTLFESGGGFDDFGSYVAAERRFQSQFRDIGQSRAAVAAWRDQRRSDDGSERERVLRWRDASDQYRRWSAEQIFPSVARAVSTPDGMFEQNDADGGAIIPPTFTKDVLDKARDADTPFRRAKVVTVPTVSGVMPGVFETSRVDGSRWGGLTANWLEEAQQLNSTFPTTANSQFRLKKLGILIPITDELFEDSALLDAFLTETCHKELMFQVNNGIVNGFAGMPNGVVDSPGTITIAKDVGQAAGTISATNVSGLWTRMHGPSRANSVFYCHQDFDPDTLGLPVTPLVGWHGEQPAATLKGRWVVPLENCQAIGTPGDLILGDFSQYLVLVNGIRKSVSAHLKFDRMETYMKIILRVDGLNLWPAPITPPHGTATKAPFVVIAQR